MIGFGFIASFSSLNVRVETLRPFLLAKVTNSSILLISLKISISFICTRIFLSFIFALLTFWIVSDFKLNSRSVLTLVSRETSSKKLSFSTFLLFCIFGSNARILPSIFFIPAKISEN